MQRRIALTLLTCLSSAWTLPAPAAEREVSGRVLDADSQPIADAQLWLVLRFDLPMRDEWVKAATTDNDGKFSIAFDDSTLSSAGMPANMLWCYKPGHNVAAEDLALFSQENVQTQLQLANSSSIDCAVKSPSGEPLVGVQIEPYYLQSGGYPILPEALRELLTVTTDDAGKTQLEGCAPGSLMAVLLTAEAYGRQLFRTNEQIVDSKLACRLSPVGGLTIQLTGGSSADRAGRSIIVGTDYRRGLPAGQGEANAELITDQQGVAHADAVVAGNILLRVSMPSDSPYRARLPDDTTISKGETTSVDIPLVEAVRLHGKVVAQGDGRPIPEAELQVRSGDSLQSESPTTNGDGVWEARVLPGSVTLYVQRGAGEFEGWVRAEASTSTLDVPADVAEFEAPTLEMVPTKTISGKLLHADGKPAVGWRLSATGQARAYSSAAVETDGAFEMKVAEGSDVEEYFATKNDPYVRLIGQITSRNPLVVTLEPLEPENVTVTTKPTPEDKRTVGGAANAEEGERIEVILAKDVLLVDGKTATWADVSDKLASGEGPEAKTIDVSFTMDGQERREEWNMWISMLSETADARQGRMSFMSADRYDRLELGEVWPPASYTEVSGSVTDPDGDPAAGVQVVLYQPTDERNNYQQTNWTVMDGRVYEYTDAIRTTTDERGQFSISLDTERPFALAAFGPNGFAFGEGSLDEGANKLELEPWARVTVSLPQSKLRQYASCQVTLPAVAGLPALTIDNSTRIEGLDYDFPAIPAGFPVQVYRMAGSEELGVYHTVGRPVQATLEPNETTHVEFGPLTKLQLQEVKRQNKQYEEMRRQRN